MIKKMLAGLVGMAAAFGTAHASDWVDTGVYGVSNHGQYFLDRQSVRQHADGTKTVWFRIEYPTLQRTRNQTYRIVKQEVRFNCRRHQIAVGPTFVYGDTGDVVSQKTGFEPMIDPAPDSIADELTKVVCATPYAALP